MFRPKRRISLFSLIVIGVLSGLAVSLYFSVTAPPPETPTSLPTEVSFVSTPTPIMPTPIPATATPLPRRDIPEGTQLLIPSAGVLADIVQVYVADGSWDVSRLGENVGHLQGTAWVTDQSGLGNVVLSGHVEMSDGGGGVFSRLNNVKVGDFVQIQTPNGAFLYNVVSITTTSPDDLTPVYPSIKPILTLITCGEYDFLRDSYLERLIVVAELVQ